MERLLKKLISLDELLSAISVSGDSVMVMARARTALKDIYGSAESFSKELDDLRYFKNTVNEKELDNGE